MFVYQKALAILVFSTLLFGFLGVASAQSMTDLTGNPYQPTPYITQPGQGALLSGTVPILITVDPPIPVVGVNIYSNNIINLVGTAHQIDGETPGGIHWELDWNSNSFPNGQYYLFAEAILHTTTEPISTFSQKVLVNVNNIIPQNPTTNPAQSSSTSSDSQTQTIEQPGQAATETANEDTSQENTNQATPAQTTETEELTFNKFQWKTIASITFPKKSDNQIDKIEYKMDQKNQEYLVFSGRATAFSQVSLTVKSQPIVLTTRADSTGGWEYILEKPLEPGNHQVTVEIIDPNGTKTTDGPYSFLISKAQATASNPTGASLQLKDANSQLFLRYFLIAAGLIIFATIMLLFIQSQKKHQTKLRGA